MHTPAPPRCVAITDGRAGNRRQADALANAMPLGTELATWVPRMPWRWWAPRRGPLASFAFGAGFSDLQARPPAVVIGCGRQSALATRLLRDRGSFAVQVLNPRLSTHHWDCVVVPEHDGLRGENVVSLVGSLNPIDDDWISTQRAAFTGLGQTPGPRTGVFIGGPTAAVPWDRKLLESLITLLRQRLTEDGGTLWVTTSRRTPPSMRRQVRAALGRVATVWNDEHHGPNPYAGQLAWADRIIVTPDSANLLSEACATRTPVHVAFPGYASGRLDRLLGQLRALGRIRPLGAELAPFSVTPLRETPRIAREVFTRWQASQPEPRESRESTTATTD